MSTPASDLRCYLAEWYRPELTAEGLAHAVSVLDECIASACAAGSPVQLVMTLAVPDDDVVFGVFAAGSEQVVARVCAQAGTPAQRLSLAFDARATHKPWANT
ncbi:MAG: hypothetical protein QOK02_6417 [Mycobacterium sp.]|jgi:hypothetical protein|nr:hypothetical protein [Mycobacterium sp.]